MHDLIKYTDVKLERKELVVLENVDFQVGPRQVVYLTGKVGSGKTTLLKSIFADIPIKSGSAEVLGYQLNSLRRKDIPYLRRNIGFVFQDFKLLDDRDIYSNLDFVLEATGTTDLRTRHDRIDQVLIQVGMSEKSYKMPHELSGGEQQRVAVARALLNKPQLILADEPTGNLDAENSDLVMNLLYSAVDEGASLLVATHNMHLIDCYPGKRIHCENKRLYII